MAANDAKTAQALLDKLQSIGDISINNGGIQHESARVSLLRTARELVRALETPEETMMDVAFAAGRNMVLRVAVDLDLFNVLATRSPRTTSELAKTTSAEELLIQRLMRTLAGMQFVSEPGEDIWAANPITQHLTKPNVAAGVIHWYDQGFPALTASPEYFSKKGYRCPVSPTDTPFQLAKQTDLDLYAHMRTADNGKAMQNFNQFMQGHFGATTRWISWFDCSPLVSGFDSNISPYLFVDVGGGRGHEAEAFLNKHLSQIEAKRGARIAAQDLPSVISDSSTAVQSRGIPVERMAYDFLTPQPIRHSRCYFLHYIIHNWSDEKSTQILRNLVHAMKPGYSRLLLADEVLPNTGATMKQTGLDIGMMYLHSGLQRSERQWRTLISGVGHGLRIERVWTPPGDGVGMVECVRDEGESQEECDAILASAEDVAGGSEK